MILSTESNKISPNETQKTILIDVNSRNKTPTSHHFIVNLTNMFRKMNNWLISHFAIKQIEITTATTTENPK